MRDRGADMGRLGIGFITMGCPKNEADTNRMQALVRSSAYELCEDAREADVVVVNTCSFLTEATEESLGVIFGVLNDEDFIASGAKLIVAGCMPSRFGDDLRGSLYEAAGFLPAAEEDHLLELVEELTGVPSAVPAGSDAAPRLRFATSVSAYVKISDGCDRFCAFCTIPFIRGRYHSRGYDEIRDEVAGLVAEGVREIVLIGQDTGIWGHDLAGDHDTAWLLEHLAETFPDTWLRIMYLQPEGLSDRLLETMARHDNICHYLDIPLQHADATVIHEMNRRGDGEEYLAMVRHIRETVPGVFLRTTVIAGFPGETREQSATLQRFLEEASFDYAGVFMYSQEEGTRAGERSDQVPRRTKMNRTQRLQDLCDAIGFRRAADNVGRTVQVLVEGIEDDGDRVELVGRHAGQAPEIDGMVHMPMGSAEVGDIVTVRLTDSFCYEYEGEVIEA